MFKIATFAIVITLFFPTYASAKPKLEVVTKTSQTETSDKKSTYNEDEFETYETKEKTEVYDPYEKINRKVFAFNEFFDRLVFEHVAKAYRNGLPKTARRVIRNFLNNLTLPVSAVNSFAQGNINNGLSSISNFLINSTIGLGGTIDIAGEKGIFYKKEDFGQTLGFYGVKPGAYLIIPFLGPSSTRDFGGWITDRAISPVGFNLLEVGGTTDLIPADYRIGLAFVSAVDTRESLIDIIDDVRKDSFDPYATIRSAYSQKRFTETSN